VSLIIWGRIVRDRRARIHAAITGTVSKARAHVTKAFMAPHAPPSTVPPTAPIPMECARTTARASAAKASLVSRVPNARVWTSAYMGRAMWCR